MNPKIKILIFDMDGVILDSEPLHACAREQMYKKYGVPLDQKRPAPEGKSTRDYWALLGEMFGLSLDADALEKEQFDLVARQVEEKQVPPSAGLTDVLQWARGQGLRIGLASSSSRSLVARVLKLLELEDYFDIVVCGDEIAQKKPAPDIYRKVLHMAGCKPDEALAVEDSDTGIRAAKSAGIYCIGYRNVTTKHQTLAEADLVIDGIRQIRDIEWDGSVKKSSNWK